MRSTDEAPPAEVGTDVPRGVIRGSVTPRRATDRPEPLPHGRPDSCAECPDAVLAHVADVVQARHARIRADAWGLVLLVVRVLRARARRHTSRRAGPLRGGATHG